MSLSLSLIRGILYLGKTILSDAQVYPTFSIGLSRGSCVRRLTFLPLRESLYLAKLYLPGGVIPIFCELRIKDIETFQKKAQVLCNTWNIDDTSFILP